MAICRFSSDNFKSDVYVYESATGWEIHVAGRRFVQELPEMPSFSAVPAGEWIKLNRARSAVMDRTETEMIGLQYDGQSLTASDVEDCRDMLLMLRDEGYHVPISAIASLEAEIQDQRKENNGELLRDSKNELLQGERSGSI